MFCVKYRLPRFLNVSNERSHRRFAIRPCVADRSTEYNASILPSRLLMKSPLLSRPRLERKSDFHSCSISLNPSVIGFHAVYPQYVLSRLPLRLLKFIKSTPPENRCKQYLRWKMAGSSAVRATEQKANAMGKSFLIPPSPATRRFSPILLTPARLLF